MRKATPLGVGEKCAHFCRPPNPSVSKLERRRLPAVVQAACHLGLKIVLATAVVLAACPQGLQIVPMLLRAPTLGPTAGDADGLA